MHWVSHSVKRPLFPKMIESIAYYIKQFKHLSHHEVWVTFLKMEVDKIIVEDLEKFKKKMEDAWKV